MSERHYNFHTKTQFVMSSIFSHCILFICFLLFIWFHFLPRSFPRYRSLFHTSCADMCVCECATGVCTWTCYTQKRTIRQRQRYSIGWRGVVNAKCENTQKATKSKNECKRMGKIKTQQQRCWKRTREIMWNSNIYIKRSPWSCFASDFIIFSLFKRFFSTF